MKALIDKNIINDGFVELFEFNDIQPRLNEDLLKFTAGVLASSLSIAVVSAISAHNLMAIKSYMKKVVKLAIEGHGDKWNEVSYKSIVNDEKRNALMITYQMSKYAGIYDYGGKDSMPNSHISMPKIAGGSDKNFKKLLKKQTKWFGLKTVSDPLKNLSSIKPAKNKKPNEYFTDILEQYRNALKRVFGESEAKQITDAINGFKYGANKIADDFEKITGLKINDEDGWKKWQENKNNAPFIEKARRTRVDAIKELNQETNENLHDRLVAIFNQVIGDHDMADYTIFKDMNKAMDDLIAAYDRNLQEAITNNRSILDKKLKKDGLIALWGKYLNLLRTAKQQAIDEFNKSPEYTYLKDFLRGSMLELFAKLLPEVQKVTPQNQEDEKTDDDKDDEEITPEEEKEEENPNAAFKVSYQYVGSAQGAGSNESYIFQHLVNKLNEADGDESQEDIVNLVLNSTSDEPLGHIVTFISSVSENELKGQGSRMRKEVASNFGNKQVINVDELLDVIPYASFINEGSYDKTEWSQPINLKSSEIHEDLGYDDKQSPYLVSISCKMDEKHNLKKDSLIVDANWRKEVEEENPEEETEETPEEEKPEEEENVQDSSDEETPTGEESSKETDELDFIVKVNEIEIDSVPDDIEKDESVRESELLVENAIMLENSDVYNVDTFSKSKDYKSVIIGATKKPVYSYNEFVQAFVDKEMKVFMMEAEETGEEGFIKKTNGKIKASSLEGFKYLYFIPRNEEKKTIVKHTNTFFAKAKVAILPEAEEIPQEEQKQLPTLVPKGELAPTGEFKIALREKGVELKAFKICVVLLSSTKEFIESINDENVKAFKNNIDKIPYNRSDAFKVLSSADNHSVILINFGEDITAVKGIKFQKDFITFEAPGDSLFFKIYPVTVADGHLILHPELASQIGEYIFNPEGSKMNTNQKAIGSQKALPGQQQKALSGNTQKQIENKNGNI